MASTPIPQRKLTRSKSGKQDVRAQLVEFEEENQFHSAIAKTTEEAQKLIEAGFDYVCNHNGMMLFRKRK